MESSSEQSQRPPQTHGRAASDSPAGSQQAMIRMLLRQTPEERLRGLVNAAKFFANARRD